VKYGRYSAKAYKCAVTAVFPARFFAPPLPHLSRSEIQLQKQKKKVENTWPAGRAVDININAILLLVAVNLVSTTAGMCSTAVDSAIWTKVFAVGDAPAPAPAPACTRCAARIVADAAEKAQLARAGLRPRGEDSSRATAGAMGALSALAFCATAQKPGRGSTQGMGVGGGTDYASASVGDKRRRARTKAKDRMMIPHATDPTRVHIHCINMCGVLYLTKTRESDKVAWTKVLRRLNAHESKRCRKKKARLAADKNMISSMASSSKMGALTAAGTAAGIALHNVMPSYQRVPIHMPVGSALQPMYSAERAGVVQGDAPYSFAAATARMHAAAAYGLVRGAKHPQPMSMGHRMSEHHLGSMPHRGPPPRAV
jgi:hypothetical protein